MNLPIIVINVMLEITHVLLSVYIVYFLSFSCLINLVHYNSTSIKVYIILKINETENQKNKAKRQFKSPNTKVLSPNIKKLHEPHFMAYAMINPLAFKKN